MTYWDTLDSSFLRGMFIGQEGYLHPSRILVVSNIPEGDSLLDLGCGSAVTLDTILHLNRDIKYTGLDFSDSYLKICKEDHPNNIFIKGNACNTVCTKDSYDNVLVRHVLEHNRAYKEVIIEALHIAKKRVYLVLFKFHEGESDIRFMCDETTSNDSIGLIGLRRYFDDLGIEPSRLQEHSAGNNKVFIITKNG